MKYGSKQLRDGDKVKLYALATGEPTLPCAIFTFRLEPASLEVMMMKGEKALVRGVEEEKQKEVEVVAEELVREERQKVNEVDALRIAALCSYTWRWILLHSAQVFIRR